MAKKITQAQLDARKEAGALVKEETPKPKKVEPPKESSADVAAKASLESARSATEAVELAKTVNRESKEGLRKIEAALMDNKTLSNLPCRLIMRRDKHTRLLTSIDVLPLSTEVKH